MPFGIGTALSYMGFTSAGVTGGSYAAGMMSATAIANGGVVPATSLVAKLMSIGAAGVGLGPVGIAATVAAGVVVGALALGPVGAGAVAAWVAMP